MPQANNVVEAEGSRHESAPAPIEHSRGKASWTAPRSGDTEWCCTRGRPIVPHRSANSRRAPRASWSVTCRAALGTQEHGLPGRRPHRAGARRRRRRRGRRPPRYRRRPDHFRASGILRDSSRVAQFGAVAPELWPRIAPDRVPLIRDGPRRNGRRARRRLKLRHQVIRISRNRFQGLLQTNP